MCEAFLRNLKCWMILNDISKSKNRGLYSRKGGEGRGTHEVSYQGGRELLLKEPVNLRQNSVRNFA